MPDPEQSIMDLWRALHGEPPPVTASAADMIQILVETLPELAWDEAD